MGNIREFFMKLSYLIESEYLLQNLSFMWKIPIFFMSQINIIIWYDKNILNK
jgi:hypothetical protein